MNFIVQFQPHQRNTETKYFKNTKYKFEFLICILQLLTYFLLLRLWWILTGYDFYLGFSIQNNPQLFIITYRTFTHQSIWELCKKSPSCRNSWPNQALSHWSTNKGNKINPRWVNWNSKISISWIWNQDAELKTTITTIRVWTRKISSNLHIFKILI